MRKLEHQVKDLTLNLLLCNAFAKDLAIGVRVAKIKAYCKRIMDETYDQELWNAARSVIKERSPAAVIKIIESAEKGYLEAYK